MPYPDNLINKYPIAEAEPEEHKHLRGKPRIALPWPEVLRESGHGDELELWDNGTDTYFASRGTPYHSGEFKLAGMYTDIQLYEFAIAHFKVQHYYSYGE